MINSIAQILILAQADDETTDRREILKNAENPKEAIDISTMFKEHWHSDDLVDTNILLIAACMLFGVLLIIYSVRAYQRRHEQAHPLTTFNAIAAELQLSVGEKLTLIRIARHDNLPTPLALLLSPATLHHHAKSFAADLGPAARQKVIFRVRQIRKRLKA